MEVAPHAGAWIETPVNCGSRPPTTVAPHAGAWIETHAHDDQIDPMCGRPPRGGVD